MNEIKIADRITIEDNGTTAIITVQGKPYENAQKIAHAMNAATWTDSDHDLTWVFRWWCLQGVTELGEAPAETVAQITSGIDTGFKEGTPEDTARREELGKAFDEAFKTTDA